MFMKKKINKIFLIMILSITLTASVSASAATKKIFKAVSEENADKLNDTASTETTTASPQKTPEVKKQKDKKTTSKKEVSKKDETTLEDQSGIAFQSNEENAESVYEVLTDIRCILYGILLSLGVVMGMELASSFQRGFK